MQPLSDWYISTFISADYCVPLRSAGRHHCVFHVFAEARVKNRAISVAGPRTNSLEFTAR